MNRFLPYFLSIFLFSLDVSAQIPNNLTVASPINPTDVTLNWDFNTCTSNYTMRYRVDGTSTWLPGISITNTGGSESYNLTGLSPLTTYNWKVKCGGNWATGPDFTTTSSACNKSVSHNISNFSPNPLTGYMQWSYDTLTITNTSNCDVNIRPEFIISHQDSAIEQGDLTIKWYNQIGGNWPNVPYSIDQNGNAYGFWNTSTGDSTGVNLTQSSTQSIIIKVRYTNANNNPNQNLAPYGTYTASWTTQEVDANGNIIQALAPASNVSLSLVNCATFTIDNITSTNNNCNGGTTGSASIISISNGSGQYAYNWSNGQTSTTATSLGAGTYSCIITDNNWGCTDSIEFIITEPLPISSSLTGTDITCNGSNDGTLNALASEGSGSYKYTWSPSLPPISSQTGLSAGGYTLTVIDLVCGGSSVSTFNINEPDLLQESATSTNNFSCDTSNCNGNISLSIIGGTLPYLISWNNGDSAMNRNDLCAGNYLITITDANSCANFTENITILNTPTTPSVSITSVNNSSCDTAICNGNILITENTGATPYLINWNNGSTSNILNNLCGNSYTYTITDTNNCITNNTIAIYDSASTPNIGSISTNITCNSLSDGTAEVSILSGSGGAGNISNITYCSSGPGMSDYSNIELVHLIGDNDSIVNNTTGQCDTYENYTSQYTTLTPGQTYTLNINLGTCHNTFAFQDGGKAYIDWNIDGDFDDSGEELGVIAITQSPSSHSITFTVPNLGIFGATRMRVISQYNSSTFNACELGSSNPFTAPYYGATEDYSIVIDGSTPATYLWSTGDTTAQISNLSAGIYTCTVTDTNGCFAIDSVTITEPAAISTIETTTDVLCNGGSSGTASLIVSGGTSPFTLNWNGADTTALSVGVHNYTITDNNGCTFSDSININEPTELTNTYTTIDVICNSANTGSIDITPNGGVSPYSFLWNNGDTTEDISNLTAGQYIVTITDANNCNLIDTVIITEPALLYATYTQTNVTCNGGTDGSANVNFFGGVQDYTLTWGTFTYPLLGGISAFTTPVGVPAGTYPYEVTDMNGCSFLDTITITEPDSIQTTSNITNVSCNGGNNGSVSLSIIGGTSPYLENWGGYDSTALSTGTYTYTITDNNGCIFTDSVTITQPLALSTTENINNVSCFGLSDGNVSLTINGGTSPYLENWGGYDSTALSIGTYTYTITDNNGCIFTDSVTITEPSLLTASATTTNVLCNGDSTGTATLTISGGTATYTQLWNNGSQYSLPAGVHHYTVTDANNCTFSDSVTINEPSILSSTITPIDLTSCLIANGSIDLNVTGGVQSYSYLWNNNDTTEDLNNLTAGNYSVIITDANGCTTSNNTLINQPSNGLSLSLISPDYNGYNISCYNGNNGTITANTNGGLGNLTYSWNTLDTIQNLNNLVAGDYSLTITDSVGCSLTDSITLNEPAELTSNFTSTDATCHGLANGSATVNFNGGVQDYILTWGTFTYPLLGGLSTFITPVGVPAGIYPYTVTDMNGCIQTDTITINQPDSFYTNLTISNYNSYNISCYGMNNGSIDIQSTGGTTPYTYYFNGNLITNTNINNLVAGIYTDSIIDANGCTFTETITLIEPDSLSNLLTTTNNSCFNSCDGLINTQINGGASPYSLLWSNLETTSTIDSLCSGNYVLNITDNNGCSISDSSIITEPSEIIISLDSMNHVSAYGGNDGDIYISSNGGVNNFTYNWSGPFGFNSSNQDINNLVAGTYFVTVIDSISCSRTDSFIINQPPSLTAYLDSVDNLNCNGICTGALYITPDGGDSVYTFLWSGPNGFTSTDEDIDSLCAGTYTLYLSDTTDTVVLHFNVLEPTPVTIISTSDTAICYNGSAQANAYAYGGNYPYQTLWSTGATTTSTLLSAGAYSVTVTDANGCTTTDSINVYQNDSISIQITVDSISCSGMQDASATLNITNGGTSPFQYSINNGTSYQNSNTFYNLSGGTHSFLVTDANGCSNYAFVTITNPSPLTSVTTSTDASCYGECDGNGSVSSTGGTAPYSYDWGTADPNNLCAGLYNVTTTDANGCLTINSLIIQEPNPIIVNIWQNGNNLEATTGFVSYQWLDNFGNVIPGATNEIFTPLSQGEYSVEVTDTNGCSITSYSISFLIDGINEDLANISIYPNPTKGILKINSNEKINNIKVIDAAGNEIMISNSKSIDLSGQPKGIYFVLIELNNQIINHRIILQ